MEPSWTGVSDNEEGCGEGAQEGTGCTPTATSLGPHRVHTPSQHLRNIGLDILQEHLLTFQEVVEDAWVIPKFCFLSQILVEDECFNLETSFYFVSVCNNIPWLEILQEKISKWPKSYSFSIDVHSDI